jgi:gelsolin
VQKFHVKAWPKDQYGHFYNGDSYIVLNVYKSKEEDELLYDVHFWIGKNSTQDEYGTAAYKTVELDTALGDKPIEHREVEGYESELFLSYFPKMTVLEGGCETGFKHVKPEEYKPRMLHFHGDRKGVSVREVPLSRRMLDSTDVYILDLGLTIFQWNGSGANKDEKFSATQYVQVRESQYVHYVVSVPFLSQGGVGGFISLVL